MAKLINGNGNTAIWAAQDADLIASICGNVTAIAAVGSQFSYTQEDANTIGVADGVIITKEGRRIQLDSGNVDLFTIPTGQLNVTSYYIIGYKLVQNSDTTQTCETFVQKMDNGTDVITEDTFKGGATEVYVSLYRVTQVGMNIDTVELLLPSMNDLSDLSELSTFLTASNDQKFRFDYQNGEYGYIIESGGADTFIPFSKMPSFGLIKSGPISAATNVSISGYKRYIVAVGAYGADSTFGTVSGCGATLIGRTGVTYNTTAVYYCTTAGTITITPNSQRATYIVVGVNT